MAKVKIDLVIAGTGTNGSQIFVNKDPDAHAQCLVLTEDQYKKLGTPFDITVAVKATEL